MALILMDRMGVRKTICLAAVIVMIACLLPAPAFAARPLITDDAGTLGKGGFQVESGIEVSDHRQDFDDVATKEYGTSWNTTVSYGLTDNIDIVLGLPYEKAKVEEDDVTVHDEDGLTDVTLEVKWRFLEKDGFALALKPGLSFPTGNDKKGLGTGRMTYGMVFIATKELEPFAFHLNAGYKRNENRVDERKDIWGADLAGEVEILKSLKLVANVGMVTNTDRESSTAPAFALGGLIYSITENIDIDLGYKRGLNRAEADNTYIGGLTIKF
ncbi:MAG: hypothetical protein A4E64_00507 [Syntrophorhabdus sp. PtaU1.Bin058]|nr:MAG: hypothetical protein A4E64_00507 [Syntrophorhabdus sp. PtaU1.Bin058]